MSNSLNNFDRSRRTFLESLAAVGLCSAFPSLSAGIADLQSKVNAYVQGLRSTGKLTPDEQTSWSDYDFTAGSKLVSINEETPRQAASMIKPFVAQAYFYRHQASPTRYPLNAEVERLMESMIRYSRNDATNELISRVSDKAWNERPKDVERVLRENGGSIFQQIDIVEYIPKGGRTYLNKASARDYSRFLYALWNERLPGSGDMKHLLGLPNADRIRHGTEQIPDVCKVLDKTGSTAQLCGNMGIVVAKGKNGNVYPYTLIGIIEKQNRTTSYGAWIRNRGDVIRGVSDLVYTELRATHGLV